ncbi:MAG: hypothetical protein K2Y39_06345, partial [Candidatus Obscuribacterales bacterium]|nr:hypothetical protein [Candidatus Obscuribacterales bacterium]
MVFRAATILACTFFFTGTLFGAAAAAGKESVIPMPAPARQGKPSIEQKSIPLAHQKPAPAIRE